MTFEEIPIATWFISERDPNLGPLFKWDDRVALDQQDRHSSVSADDEVLIVRLPDQPAGDE